MADGVAEHLDVAGDDALHAKRLADRPGRAPAFGNRDALGGSGRGGLAVAAGVLQQRTVQARWLVVHRRRPERAQAACRLREVV